MYDYEPLLLAIRDRKAGECIVVVSCSSFKLMVSVVEFLKSHSYTRDVLDAANVLYKKERALQASDTAACSSPTRRSGTASTCDPRAA